MNKVGKIAAVVAGAISGFVLVIAVVAQIILSPSVCASLIERYYPEFIDGKLAMSKVGASIFRRFPAVTLEIKDLAITYPAERFDSSELSGVDNWMVHAGTYASADSIAVPMDTLASFDRFELSLNVASLLRGVINIKNVELVHPRVFVHYYADGNTNLNVIKPLAAPSDSLDAEDSTSGGGLPDILLRHVSLGSHPRIFYSDQRDTLMAMLSLRNFAAAGHISTSDILGSRFKLNLDTLFVVGNYGLDSLLFSLDHFNVRSRHQSAKLDAEAVAYAGTHAFGRVKVPFSLDGELSYDQDGNGVWSVQTKDLKLDLATVGAVVNMGVSLADSLLLKGNVAIPDIDVQRLLEDYVGHFYADASKVTTDAHVGAALNVDGFFNASSGAMPAFNASLDVAPCRFVYSDMPLPLNLELHAAAHAGQNGPVNAEISALHLNGDGIDLNCKATACDLLGPDVNTDIDASLQGSLGALGKYLSDALGMDVAGEVKAAVNGHLNLGGMTVYDLKGSTLKADVALTGIDAHSFDDSLNVYADRISLKVALMEDKFQISRKSADKVLGAALKVDSVYFRYADNNVSGRNIRVLAQSSPSQMTLSDGSKVNPVLASLALDNIYLKGSDSTSIRVRDSKNRLRFAPSKDGSRVPGVHLSSNTARVRMKSGPHRIFMRELGFEADALMQQKAHKRDKRLTHYMDSLYRVHPAWTRDSVRAYMASRMQHRDAPKWLTEEDFKKADIHIDLGETFRKYFTQWQINGMVRLGRMGVATPAFPMRTSVTGFHGSFDNDKISLDTLHVVAGESNFSADGTVSNLRRVLTRNGMIKLRMKVLTDSLAVGKLLNAYAQGQKNMKTDMAFLSDVDDSAYEKTVTEDDQADALTEDTGLIVVPANVDARIALRGKGLTYSTLHIARAKADILMKERCLQLKDFRAKTNAGDMSMDAFYSTQTKKDVYAGFDLSMKDVSAEQIIELVPAVDSLMPLLKSFGGYLNCNLAATTRVDTSMNVITPSMNGVMRIEGKDLHFTDNPQMERIGKLLLFKKPKRATIDTMTVEGVIRDNYVEIFPFLVKMDRWTLAMAGVQNLDKSFNYHVSLVKTPLLLHLGADISGSDFDHMKFKLGKAKYRNNQVPSYSQAIDTTRINLVSSIRNIFVRGVKQAVNDNIADQQIIQRERDRSHYSRSVALEAIESLSEKEQKQIDSLSVTGL